MRSFDKEKDHLKEQEASEVTQETLNVLDLRKQGKSVREIASVLGLSKSKVDRIIQQTKNNTALTGETKDEKTSEIEWPAEPTEQIKLEENNE